MMRNIKPGWSSQEELPSRIASEHSGTATSNLSAASTPKKPGALTPTIWKGWSSEPDYTADDVRITAVPVLPEAVAEYRCTRAATEVIVRGE